MQVETLRDVLKWTREFHQHLADCMQHCADQNESERAKLLLEYLAEHEQTLVGVLEGFSNTADENALDTWCYEYLDKHPIIRHEMCDKPYAEMHAGEIITEISHQHGQVIELYRYLRNRAETVTTQELLDQLLSLEQHEIMCMAQSANRLEDM